MISLDIDSRLEEAKIYLNHFDYIRAYFDIIMEF